MARTQAGEASEVGVCSDELTPMLDRERRMVRVRHELAAGGDRRAQPRKDRPVIGSGPEPDAVRACLKLIDEPERGDERRWLLEHAAVRDDADKPACGKLGEPKWLISLDECNRPRRICLVIGRLRAMSVDQDVDVSDAHPGPHRSARYRRGPRDRTYDPDRC